MELTRTDSNEKYIRISGYDYPVPVSLPYTHKSIVTIELDRAYAPEEQCSSTTISFGPFKWRVDFFPNGTTEHPAVLVALIVPYSAYTGVSKAKIELVPTYSRLQAYENEYKRLYHEEQRLFQLASTRSLRGLLHIQIDIIVEQHHATDHCYAYSLSTMPTRCNEFPTFFERLYTPLLCLADEKLPEAIEYEFFDLKTRSVEPHTSEETDAEENMRPAKRRSLTQSSSSLTEPSLPSVRFGLPKSISGAIGIKNYLDYLENKFPTSSILAFIVHLLGGTLAYEYPPTADQWVILLHVAFLERKYGLEGHGFDQLALFLKTFLPHQVDYKHLLGVIWVDCNQDRDLLNLVVKSLNTFPVEKAMTLLRAFANHIGSLSALNTDIFIDLICAVKLQESMALPKHMPIVIGAKPIEASDGNFTLRCAPEDQADASTDSESSTSNSDTDSVDSANSVDPRESGVVNIWAELLYAQWAYFRQLYDDNTDNIRKTKTLILPINSRALHALSLALEGLNKESFFEGAINLSASSSLLTHGKRLGLFGKITMPLAGYRDSGAAAIFEPLVKQCLQVSFPKLTAEWAFYQLRMARIAGIEDLETYILRWICKNERSVRKSDFCAGDFDQLPEELQAAVARAQYAQRKTIRAKP